jgi:hypothetical protein
MRGQLPIGSVLAGYRIIELIGDGAGGAVYLAEQEESGERVALKVLADELARDDRFRRRFLRESTIAAGLRHPYVRMCVPGSSRAGREVNAARGQPRAAGRRRDRVDEDLAGEPVARSAGGLDGVPGDLHHTAPTRMSDLIARRSSIAA